MRSGSLKQSITVLTSQVVKDEYGSESITYSERITTRAEVTSKQEDRTIVNDAIIYPQILTVYIRDYHVVNESDIIRFNGADYSILSIYPNLRRHLIEIKCTKLRYDTANT